MIDSSLSLFSCFGFRWFDCNFLSISTSIVEVHLKLEVNRRTGVAPIGRIYMHHRADGFTQS